MRINHRRDCRRLTSTQDGKRPGPLRDVPGRLRLGSALLISLGLIPCLVKDVRSADVPRFGLFERSFAHTGKYDNPYAELSPSVNLTAPDGQTRRATLFWDGGTVWKLRFSPDALGTWKWTLASRDSGLDGNSGSFRVVESEKRGGICPMDGFGRHFQRQDGSPFWFFGDTAWALYTDNAEEKHDRASAQKYIDARAEQGFNVVHSMLISEAGWGNRGGDAFVDLKTQRINPDYWREVDARLGYLNLQGITGGLALAWSNKGHNPNNWKHFPSAAARQRYARYVTARYAALDVYFIVGGEWDIDGPEPEVKAGYVALGDVIEQNDPHGRMITIHPGSPRTDGSVQEFVGTGWMSFGDYQQNYRNLHARVFRGSTPRPAGGQFGIRLLLAGSRRGRQDG